MYLDELYFRTCSFSFGVVNSIQASKLAEQMKGPNNG